MNRDKVDILEEHISDLKAEINYLRNQVTPTGTIVLWSGNIEHIPKGWVLCDGKHTTPDLSDRFVLGYGSTYNQIGQTGGNMQHNHDITVLGHQLTVNQIPAHSHSSAAWGHWYNKGSCTNTPTWRIDSNLQPPATNVMKTNETGGNQPHSHGAQSDQKSHCPPFIVLAYIMKL
eukprot:UN10432